MEPILRGAKGKIFYQLSLFGLAAVAVFSVTQAVSAGPITNPGGAPFIKVGAYQGVIAIVPVNGSAVMELGNAGSDIASSADIYIRPDAIARDSSLAAYFYNNGGKAGLNLPGQANLGYVNVLAQGGPSEGGELTLQPAQGFTQWYLDSYQDRLRIFKSGQEFFTISNATGNTYIASGQLCFGAVGSTDCSNTWGAAGGTPTLDQVLGAGNTGNTKTIAVVNQAANAQSIGVTSGASLGSGSFAFLLAKAAANGSYSDVTRANDSGLFFNQGTGFTFGGWNPSGTIKGIRLSGGTLGNAALAVNNGLAGVGSSGDGIAVYANSPNSAVYAQQNSAAATAYAGYFSGDVNITGTFTLQGRVKPQAVQVCQIGTDTCIGRYLYTTGTARDATMKFFYDTGSAIASVSVYTVSGTSYSCSGAPAQVIVNRSLAGLSYWSQAGCTVAEYVQAGGTPYGSGRTCEDTVTVYAFAAYNTTNCNSPTTQNNLRRLSDGAVISTPTYAQDYELR